MLTPKDERPYMVQMMVDLGRPMSLHDAVRRARQLGALINNSDLMFDAQWSLDDMYVVDDGMIMELEDVFTLDERVAAEQVSDA